MRNMSVGLSSMTTMQARRCWSSPSPGDCEEERGPNPGFGFDPHSALISFDNAPAYGEPHSVAGVLRVCMKAFKDAKDSLLISGRDSDAIVRNTNGPMAVHSGCRQMDAQRRAVAIFNCIANQVLKDLRKMALMHADHG